MPLLARLYRQPLPLPKIRQPRFALAAAAKPAAPLVGPEDILITADTMVFLENDRLGKPRDEADALRMLRAGATRIGTSSGVAIVRERAAGG